MELHEGEYFIPDGYSVKQVGRTLRVYKKKRKTLCEGEYRCKDCKFRKDGYSKNSGRWQTKICEQRPAGLDKNGMMRYYAVVKYGKPCEKFKLVTKGLEDGE